MIEREKRRGTRLLKVLVATLCSAYALYLFNLQVVRNREFTDKAQKFAVQSVRLPARRGEIYDRTRNVVLASNTEAFSVEIVPAELPDSRREEVFAALSGLLGIPSADISKKIPPKFYHLYQPVTLSSSSDYRMITYLAEHTEDFPGVYWNSRPLRSYRDLESLSHIIGYVGEIGRDEYKILYNKGYASDDMVGKDGIEKTYDSILKGKDGRLFKTVDVKGRDLQASQSTIEPPVHGKNLVLTIDNSIQKIAQKALGERMGSVIVLKPATGEILAMVSYPWFDSNIFSSPNSGAEYAKLLADPNTPLMNRAIQSSYPPASTFKTVLSTAILEEKALSPLQEIVCRGAMTYGGRDWNCHIHRPGHGPLNLKEALEQSCDIYYWTAGRDYLGIEKIVSYTNDFGFGKSTGIDLPAESAGFVPTPQWKERTYNERWTPGDTMNLSIGQGYMLATPLQVANMIALVANGGTVYKPFIVKEIRDPETGALISSAKPERLLTASFRKSTFDGIRDDLRGVIFEGTAKYPISTKVVKIAGKTGTAEVGLKDRWHSWFASYGPCDAPPEDQIVVVTMIEASNPWEWWAPYCANVIYQAVFAGQDAESAAAAVGVSLSAKKVRGRSE